MRLGISSYTCFWAIGGPAHRPDRPMDALGLLQRAVDLGVRVVQVADNLPLDRLSPDDLDAFAERADELDLEVEVGTRGIAGGNLDLYLRLAERLDSKILRVVVDTPQHQPDEHEIVQTIQGLVPELERTGVYLAIENHDRLKVETLARIVARAGSTSVGICLDTVNSLGAAQGPEVVAEVLGPWAVNLHVKDFSIRRVQHTMGLIVEGCPVGQGQLDVPGLLARLREMGRDPNAIIEMWMSPEETVTATVAKEAVWTAESIDYLRQFIPD